MDLDATSSGVGTSHDGRQLVEAVVQFAPEPSQPAPVPARTSPGGTFGSRQLIDVVELLRSVETPEQLDGQVQEMRWWREQFETSVPVGERWQLDQLAALDEVGWLLDALQNRPVDPSGGFVGSVPSAVLGELSDTLDSIETRIGEHGGRAALLCSTVGDRPLLSVDGHVQVAPEVALDDLGQLFVRGVKVVSWQWRQGRLDVVGPAGPLSVGETARRSLVAVHPGPVLVSSTTASAAARQLLAPLRTAVSHARRWRRPLELWEVALSRSQTSSADTAASG